MSYRAILEITAVPRVDQEGTNNASILPIRSLSASRPSGADNGGFITRKIGGCGSLCFLHLHGSSRQVAVLHVQI